MEILIRLFVKILDYIYGRMPKPANPRNPLAGEVLRKIEEEEQAQKRQQIVDSFKSSATPQQGAIDYDDISWGLFTRAVETAVRFDFYRGRDVAKMIEKSRFTTRQELITFRRVIRRRIADCKLLPD